MTAQAGSPRVLIDRRPIAVVVASRFRRQLIFAALVALFLVALGHPPAAAPSTEAWRVLCVFIFSVVLWVSALLPMAITSLLAIASIPLLGILPEDEAYAFFGSRVVFFILGAFILAAAMSRSGLSTRLTLLGLRACGASPRRLTLGVYVTAALFASIMSAHAVAALLFPVVLEIARALRLVPRRSSMGRSLFFALAWGSTIGGTATILGGGRAALAIGILERVTDGQYTIGFLEYAVMALPVVLALLVAGGVLLAWLNPPEIDSVAPALEVLEARINQLGALRYREAMVGLTMLGTVGAWMFFGDRLGIANIAILATGLLFALRLVSWSDLEATVNWAIILMYGGAICLGAAMEKSGAAAWITSGLIGGFLDSPIPLLIAIAVLCTVLTELMSNSAVVAVMMPAALSLGVGLGVDPRVCAMAVVLASSFAYVMPMATPGNAIAFSAGYYRPTDAVRYGALLGIFGLVSFSLLVTIWWPLLGFAVGK